MLLNYSVTNYGGFKETATLSMMPGVEMQRYEDNEVDFKNDLKVLKSAVIVGENGGGKTTLARSMRTLQDLVSASNKVLKAQYGTVNANLQHLYPAASQKYELEAVIEINGEIYTYHFLLELDGEGIVQEFLFRRKSTSKKEELIYSTNRKNGIELNSKYFPDAKKFDKSIQDFPMGTVLSRVGVFGQEVVTPFIEWMANSLVVKCTEFADLSIYSALEADEQTLTIIQSKGFAELFRLADSSIVRIEIDKKDPYRATKVIRMDENGEEYGIPLIAESTGIREFFCWSEQIWKILYENKTVFADEVDRVLNPVLASRLIAYVNNSKHKGQFIFTTHNALHLNFDDFRKEQMWIVSKGEEPLTSELYSIADFRGIRYSNKHLYEAYLNGFLGGIEHG
jgi:AAA15 family ATPase/GTPase